MPPARGAAAAVLPAARYRRRKGEPKGFTWPDYRDLIIATHRQLGAPLVWWPKASGRCSSAPSPTSPPPNLDYLVRIVKRKLENIQYRRT